MTASESFVVVMAPSARLHDLRRRVLRGGDPTKNVVDERDSDDSSLHFAGMLGERVVVAGSFYPSTSPVDPSLRTYQLRYLATDFDVQGRGLATHFMRAAETQLASRGAEQLWANGRDTALEFYERNGWSLVVGSEHLSPETQLPHTVIYKTLRRDDPIMYDWATIDDAQALAQLREEMHFSISMRAFDREWIDASRTYFIDGIGDGSLLVAVARTVSGEVVGSAAATLRRIAPSPRFPKGSSSYVHTVSTAPGFRRRGISKRLMQLLIEELRQREVERIDLHATDQGEPIYRELGFEEHSHGRELRLGLREPKFD